MPVVEESADGLVPRKPIDWKTQTFMSNVHLALELLELLGVGGLGLGAHLLASPLHGTVNLACEVHDVVISVESSNWEELSTKK